MVKTTRLLWEGRDYPLAETAFVSLARPDVLEGLERCRLLGARQIVVARYFLFPGVLPDRVAEQARQYAAAHPELDIRCADVLGDCDEVAALVYERYHEALSGDIRMNCDMCVYRIAMPGFEHRVGEPQHPHDHPHDHDSSPPAPMDDGYPARAARRHLPGDRRAARRPPRVPAGPGARRRARPGARGGPPGAVGGLLAAMGLHRDHRPGAAGADRGAGPPARRRVRGGPARRAGPRVRPAEDRVDPRHAGQHRGQLRPYPRRPAHARPARPAADRRVLQRARGGQPLAGGPGRGPRRRLGELLRRARARRRARAARAPGGDRLPLRGLRHLLRGRARTSGVRLGAVAGRCPGRCTPRSSATAECQGRHQWTRSPT